MDGDFFVKVASGAFTIALAVLTYVIVPWIRGKVSADNLAKITLLVKLAVESAEQFFKVKGKPTTGEEKKMYALAFVRNLGVDIEYKDLDALIEAMVYQMNLAKRSIPDGE